MSRIATIDLFAVPEVVKNSEIGHRIGFYHINRDSLQARLKESRFLIPNFQRDFERKPRNVRDLMRSIFLDYCFGSLLLWKGKEENFDALNCEEIHGFSSDRKRKPISLNGQQRMTAIFHAFTAPEMLVPSRNTPYYHFIHVDRSMTEEYPGTFGQ